MGLESLEIRILVNLQIKGMKTLLDELFSELNSVNSPLATAFNEGIEKRVVAEKIQYLPINLPEEVYELYTWKNGLSEEQTSLKTIGEQQIFPLGIFSPLEISIEAYKYYALENKYWQTYMFPIFESRGGDYFLINCNNNSDSSKMIVFFQIHYRNLMDLLSNMIP